ncbi:Transposon Ty3-I Gag-Pol polyprotein [Gossypium australe]|uniref:Transposon Ty3-I Gag-Pol polyprotein n=1 Tax=Gossypium australe TaxID=47621 RepID=A0A5B6VX16_9ROSI|nr:Transposon Ty3-I Gag-Pol polyprotein [Gossypium australe]
MKGVLEDVLVKVHSFIVPTDFVVLDFEEDQVIPILLGRLFLSKSRATIDLEKSEITMRINGETETFRCGYHQSEKNQSKTNKTDTPNVINARFKSKYKERYKHKRIKGHDGWWKNAERDTSGNTTLELLKESGNRDILTMEKWVETELVSQHPAPNAGIEKSAFMSQYGTSASQHRRQFHQVFQVASCVATQHLNVATMVYS